MDLTGIGGERVDWIYLAVDMDKWRSPVNTIVNFLVHKMWGNF
jgi:hypothetical protein